MGILTDIERLIYALPTKDIELANKFIRERLTIKSQEVGKKKFPYR